MHPSCKLGLCLCHSEALSQILQIVFLFFIKECDVRYRDGDVLVIQDLREVLWSCLRERCELPVLPLLESDEHRRITLYPAFHLVNWMPGMVNCGESRHRSLIPSSSGAS